MHKQRNYDISKTNVALIGTPSHYIFQPSIWRDHCECTLWIFAFDIVGRTARAEGQVDELLRMRCVLVCAAHLVFKCRVCGSVFRVSLVAYADYRWCVMLLRFILSDLPFLPCPACCCSAKSGSDLDHKIKAAAAGLEPAWAKTGKEAYVATIVSPPPGRLTWCCDQRNGWDSNLAPFWFWTMPEMPQCPLSSVLHFSNARNLT